MILRPPNGVQHCSTCNKFDFIVGFYLKKAPTTQGL